MQFIILTIFNIFKYYINKSILDLNIHLFKNMYGHNCKMLEYLFHLTNPDPGVTAGSEQNSAVFHRNRRSWYGQQFILDIYVCETMQ